MTTGHLRIRDGQTVVFIGDSITDCGRSGPAAPLGDGYVRDVAGLIAARYPRRRITVHNRGVAGQAVNQLQARWAEDVLRLKPDWLSVLVGINDCHRELFFVPDEKIPPEQFRRMYREVLTRTRRRSKAKLVLMDPFYATTDADPTSRGGRVLRKLPEYVEVVASLAEEFGAVRVRLHELVQEHLKYRPAEALAADAVHPTAAGHLLIAHAWLTAVGW
jgi:lysophospholipase L1-like esterase